MARSISATEAKNRLGAYLKEASVNGEDVVIENHGRPQAVLIPYDAYREIAAERDRQRRLKAIDELEALAVEVRARNADLTDEEAEAIAEEISQAAIDNLVRRGVLRFERDRA